MAQRYQVRPYSIDRLKRLFSSLSGMPESLVSEKAHLRYFENYFGELGAREVVVEPGYVDQHFLEDFAEYYVRCYADYDRKCTRLHFFDFAFSPAAFSAFLEGRPSPLSAKRLNDGYLGFIVVRPLPQRFIGRTCLKTYPPDGERRHYPIVRGYSANLFGIPLTVESLAFQEQDHVVAACATSALWSAFQGTGKRFQHPIPSPVDITEKAKSGLPSRSRTFPNVEGLSVEEMANAIRAVGLEPYYVGATEPDVLKTTLFGYVAAGIPVILGIQLVDNIAQTYMDKHAVAVTGYSLGLPDPAPHLSVLVEATKIDKIYVHDDQVGPFARMEFDGVTVPTTVGGIPRDMFSLSTELLGPSRTPGAVRALPYVMLVPLYHKIRIPFDHVLSVVFGLDGEIEAVRASNPDWLPKQLTWNIRLTTVNDLKTDLFGRTAGMTGPRLRDALTAGLPRFIWRCTASFGTSAALDVLFDATDIPEGRGFLRAISYDSGLLTVLQGIAKTKTDARPPERYVYEWFANYK